jgi:hypothetical protein
MGKLYLYVISDNFQEYRNVRGDYKLLFLRLPTTPIVFPELAEARTDLSAFSRHLALVILSHQYTNGLQQYEPSPAETNMIVFIDAIVAFEVNPPNTFLILGIPIINMISSLIQIFQFNFGVLSQEIQATFQR